MRLATLFREHGIFILLFCLVAILRLAPLAEYQFTYDEISALQRVSFADFSGLLDGGVRIDAHPALLQTIIYFLTQWFGFTTWIIKLPFIILSLATLPYAYAFCRRNFPSTAGLNATILFGFSLACMYYAPIARMYGCGMFFSVALLFHFYEIILRPSHSLLHYTCFAFFLWIGALNHHMNALFAATVYVSGFVYLRREQLRRYIAAGAIPVLLYLPHLPITIYQLSVGGIGVDQGGWLEPPRATAFLDALNVLCGSGYGLAVIAGLALLAMAGRHDGPPRGVLLLPVLFVTNFLFIFLYSLFRAPVYQHSLMLFSGSGLLLFIAGILTSRRIFISYVVSGLLLTWLLWQTFVQKDFYRQTVKTINEYQFERTSELKDVLGDRLVPIFFDADSLMRTMYFEKYDDDYFCLLSTSPQLATIEAFSRFVDTTAAHYLSLASSQPLHQAAVRDRFPYLVEKTVTQAVHYKVFSRLAGDSLRIVADDDRKIYNSGDPKGFHYPETELPLHVSGDDEYPFHVSASYREVISHEGATLLAEARVDSPDRIAGLQCCISITGQSGSVLHYNAATVLRRLSSPADTHIVRAQLFIGNLHHHVSASDRINIYLWNRAGEQFLLHELTVSAVDHWYPKWHYWD